LSNNVSESEKILYSKEINVKNFKVIRKIGKGAFGTVLLVEKKDTGKL